MAPLHVLHVSRAVNTGLAHCVANYVEHQTHHGLRVTVACPGGRLGTLAAAHGAAVIDWSVAREPGVGMLAEAVRLGRILRRVRPDVIHLHCAKAGLLGRIVVRRRIPTVFSPHSWSFVGVGGVTRWLTQRWERFAARWTSVVMCVSAAERDGGLAAGIGGRLVVLPNEVSISAADAIRRRPREAVRANLGVHWDTPLTVCTARLAHQKGQDTLLAAWDAVRAAVPGAELALVGDGPDRSSLEAAAGPGVRFVGAADREQAQLWMYAADLVACPSRWEGMSLVPLEAMALGRPLVVSDVDGMTEAIPTGAGTIIPPDDVSALARAVIAFIGDPEAAAQAGKIGRHHAESQIGKQDSADRLLALYAELTAAGSASR